jgi:hypothetical protein
MSEEAKQAVLIFVARGGPIDYVDVPVANVEHSLGTSRLIWLPSVYKGWQSHGLTLRYSTNNHEVFRAFVA